MSSETKLVCSTCISCPKEEILRRLQRETTCSACCSALRLMTERPLAELVLLDSFVDREDETGYVLNEDLASPAALEAACAKFPLQEWLKNCQPLKRDKRCPMHTNSRHIFNQADLWEDMWAELSAAQKATICAVGAGELHDKLWQHCTDKHHLCKDCRSNVMWAYDRLTKKELPPVGTEAEQEAELSSLQAYFDIERSTEGTICVHSSALPTILYHYEDTLAEEAESSSKGRHAPTRQAGLSELLCVVGRLLLRKVLTSYQTSLEEEQNQQLLVRLVLSHFQAQTLERHAAQCAESLLEGIEHDAGKASKRKLKKERQKHRREAEAEEQAVTWDEQQELALLSKMGWSNAAAVALGGGGESAPGGGGAADATGGGAHPPPANGCGVAGGGGGDGRATEREAAAPGRGGAELDAARALALHPVDAASLELTESEQREFSALARQKGQLMEERDRMRAAIRERFERFALGGSKGVA